MLQVGIYSYGLEFMNVSEHNINVLYHERKRERESFLRLPFCFHLFALTSLALSRSTTAPPQASESGLSSKGLNFDQPVLDLCAFLMKFFL